MDANKIGLIVATHGDLAEAMVRTAEIIVERKTTLRPFSFKDGEDPKSSSRRLRALIRKCGQGSGVIILVDLFGGTPGSLALSHLDEKRVEVVTGVNLAMAIAAATLPAGLDLQGAGEFIAAAGNKSIQLAGAMLKP